MYGRLTNNNRDLILEPSSHLDSVNWLANILIFVVRHLLANFNEWSNRASGCVVNRAGAPPLINLRIFPDFPTSRGGWRPTSTLAPLL